MTKTIGYVTIPAGTVVTDRSFETAAWWVTLELAPGRYPITGRGGYVPSASIPGTVTAAHFGSPYDHQEVGQTRNYGLGLRDYELAGIVAAGGEQGGLSYEVADGLAIIPHEYEGHQWDGEARKFVPAMLTMYRLIPAA